MNTVINVDRRVRRYLLSAEWARTPIVRSQKLENSTSDQRGFKWNEVETHAFTRRNFKLSLKFVASRANAPINKWMSQLCTLALSPMRITEHKGYCELQHYCTAKPQTKRQGQGQVQNNCCTSCWWQPTVPQLTLKRNWPEPTVHTTRDVQDSLK